MRLVQLLCLLFIVSNLSYIASRQLYYLALSVLYSEGYTTICNKLFKAQGIITAVYFIAYNLLHWIYAFKFWSLSKRMELMVAKKDINSQNVFL